MRVTVTTLSGLSCSLDVEPNDPLTVRDLKQRAVENLFRSGPSANGTLAYRRLARQGAPLKDEQPLLSTEVCDSDNLVLVVVAATQLAVGFGDGGVSVLDVTAPEGKLEQCSWRFGDAVVDLAWRPDGQSLAVASDFENTAGGASVIGRFATFLVPSGEAKGSAAELQAPSASVDWAPRASKISRGLTVADKVRVHLPQDDGRPSTVLGLPALRITSAGFGTAFLTEVCWSPDSSKIAIAVGGQNASGGVAILAKDTERLLWSWDCWRAVHAVAWSPDGRYLAVGSGDIRSGGMICLLMDGRVERTWRKAGAVRSLSWNPDGSRLAAATCDWVRGSGALHIFSMESGEEERAWYMESVLNCVAWSPDGESVAAGLEDGLVRLLKPQGAEVRRMNLSAAVRKLSWSPSPPTRA